MLSGRSLQSSVESFKAASGAVQFIKAAFGLPDPQPGSGADSPIPDGQSMSERAMLSMLMGLSGSDILGGAGQLEEATVVSPLQLIADNEVIGMVRQVARGMDIDDETLAYDVIAQTKPGDHFLTSKHTLRHCRSFLRPGVFARTTREAWEREGKGSDGPVSRALPQADGGSPGLRPRCGRGRGDRCGRAEQLIG